MNGIMDLTAAAVRIATPLILAAIGGLLSERAGVFAVGLPLACAWLVLVVKSLQ